jgi:hypothetical protein
MAATAASSLHASKIGRFGIGAVEVVAHPDGVEAEAVELERRVAHLLPGALDLRQRHSEADRSCHAAR